MYVSEMYDCKQRRTQRLRKIDKYENKNNCYRANLKPLVLLLISFEMARGYEENQ